MEEIMGLKPTYEQLEKRIAQLEAALLRRREREAPHRAQGENHRNRKPRLPPHAGVLAESAFVQPAEKALKESREWYRTLFERANDAIFIENENDTIVDVNPKACRLLGYRRDELIGKTVADIQAPETRGRLGEIIKSELACHGGRTFETVDLHKDGTRIPVEVSTNRLGQDNLVLSIVRDIRQRKAAQEALDEAFRIIEKSPAAAFVWDKAEGWPVRFVTPNVVTIFGYSSEEFTSGTIAYADVIHPDDLERVAAEVEHHSVAQGRSEFVHEPYRIVTKEGNINWVEDKTTVRRDGLGRITGYQGIVEDISARRAAEEALRVSEEKFAKAFHTSPDAIVITGVDDGRFVDVNDGFVRLSGYRRQEVIGRTSTELGFWVRPGDRKNYVEALGAHGSVRDLEAPFRIKSGEVRLGLVSGDIIRVGCQNCIIGTIRDITEARKMENEILKVEKLESIGVLAGGIAHDFNNFLAGIIGNLSLAKLDTRPGERITPILDDIEKAALRAKNLTQQLLTFSKGGEPVKQTTDLADLVKDAALFALRGSNVRCEFNFQPDLRLAEVDEGQITQVIHNLILNADQAMPSGGIVAISGENVTLPANNAVALDAGEYVKLVVQDGGTGIKKEYLKKIFDPYFTTKQKGSGLGLAVAFSVIEKHDGRIGAESKLGEGTTFTIHLPAACAMKTGGKKTQAELADGAGRRVLVMDDEAFIRKLAGQMLTKMGCRVAFAEDGEEAIDRYRQALESGDPFDAVILDLTVPGRMGGKEAVKAILRLDPDAHAIVSSGYSNDPVIAGYGRFGFRQAIRKPYLIQEMSAALKEIRNR